MVHVYNYNILRLVFILGHEGFELLVGEFEEVVTL